jgi:hypothetical protein
VIATTYNSESVLLVTEAPNWAAPVEGTLELVRNDEASLSNREGRRPWSATLRVPAFKYTALLSDNLPGRHPRTFLGAVKSLTEQAVAVPFWPGETTWSARASAPITGGLKLVWKTDWSQWEIYETTEPVWPAAGDRWAPLLWGFLENDKATAWLHGELGEFEVRFTEDSPADWALTPVGSAATAGPLPPAGYTTAPDLLDFAPNWSRQSHTLRVSVAREQPGLGRRRVATYYEQLVAALCEQGFLLTSAEDIGEFVCFFGCHAGGDSFWLDSGLVVARLTSAAGSGDTVLTVADTDAVAVGDYVKLGTITRRVTATTSTTITVNSALGAAVASGTGLTALLLVCWDRPRLELVWTHGALASVRTRLREVPAEYAPAADETRGTTLGALPERAVLYEFIRNYGNGTTVSTRWTSHEQDVLWNGQTWTTKPGLSHGDLRQSLNLEREDVELTTFLDADNPLLADLNLTSEGTLTVVIRIVDLLDDGCTCAGEEAEEDPDEGHDDVRIDNPDLFPDPPGVPPKLAGLPAPVLYHLVTDPLVPDTRQEGPDNGEVVVYQTALGDGQGYAQGWEMASEDPVEIEAETYNFSGIVAGVMYRYGSFPSVWDYPAATGAPINNDYTNNDVIEFVVLAWSEWTRVSDAETFRSPTTWAAYQPDDAP